MKRAFCKGPLRFVFIPLAIAAFLSLISLVVMQLWNHLLPAILGVSAITFWQAMGIFILCKILFGFGKGGRCGSPWMRGRGHMAERFKHMTPEERIKFREEMGNRCGWRKRGFSDYPDFNTDKNTTGTPPTE